MKTTLLMYEKVETDENFCKNSCWFYQEDVEEINGELEQVVYCSLFDKRLEYEPEGHGQDYTIIATRCRYCIEAEIAYVEIFGESQE